ncbi:Ni2+-binding GTPase [Paenibacillus sp. NPDC058367]|uniref:Ni2+-binding GTPase n=1 Tax=Paenibacillus sp. NPDC058367 TaxID=3346460 RepID=UPI00366085AF
MNEKIDEYKERLALIQQNGNLSIEAEALLEEMMADLVELNRSNKALRRAIMKTGQASTMSTRLRDALYE